eukprot:1249640-Amphidinium_carterae.1
MSSTNRSLEATELLNNSVFQNSNTHKTPSLDTGCFLELGTCHSYRGFLELAWVPGTRNNTSACI